MNHCIKLVSVLSAGTLLGCTQLALGPTGGTPVAATGSRAPAEPRVQPFEHISSPVSEVEGLFIMGRSAHGAGQLALAEERYAQVLATQPSHLGALNSIAVIYAQTERTSEAIQFFKRALEIDPKASYVHNNLGYVFLLTGELVEAEAEFKLAHDLMPASLKTRQNLELLNLAKERAAALAGRTGGAGAAEAAVSGPQLVAVSKNIYELRDRPATLPAQTHGATRADAQPEKPVPGLSLHGARIEVSNGVGIRHLARRTAHRLAPMGVVTVRLTNQPRFQQAKTEIQFSAGHKSAAEALSSKLPVTVRTVPSGRLERNIQMRLVLGHDLIGKAMAAWLESSGDASVALAGHDGWRWS